MLCRSISLLCFAAGCEVTSLRGFAHTRLHALLWTALFFFLCFAFWSNGQQPSLSYSSLSFVLPPSLPPELLRAVLLGILMCLFSVFVCVHLWSNLELERGTERERQTGKRVWWEKVCLHKTHLREVSHLLSVRRDRPREEVKGDGGRTDWNIWIQRGGLLV